MKNSTSARSPLSPTLWPADAFIWWQSLLFAIALFVSSFAGAITFGILWYVEFGIKDLKHPPLGLLLTAQVASYLPILLLAWLVLPPLAKRSLRELGLRLPTVPELGIALAGALAMFVVSTAIGAFEQNALHLKIEETAVDLMKTVHGRDAWIFGFVACIFAPIVEEFAFRAFLMNALLRYMPIAGAAIISGLLFGCAHGSWTALAPLAGAGIVLAYVYYRTGALTVSMLAHAGFNLIGVIGFFVFKLK